MKEEYLLSVIAAIEQQHRDSHHAPTYALREEIMEHINEDMRQCLGKLLHEKKINYHKTLNSWAVETNK